MHIQHLLECIYSTSLTKESALLLAGQDKQWKHLFMIIDKPTPIEAFHHCFHTEHGLLLNDLAILCSHRLIPGCHFCWLLLFWPCKFLQPYLSQASTLILQRLKLFQHPLSYRFTLSFKLDLCTPDFKFQAHWWFFVFLKEVHVILPGIYFDMKNVSQAILGQ